MNYFIYTLRHFTPQGRYELNKVTSLPMCGFIAQLVEHRTGIAEVTRKINCDEHSSLRLITSVSETIYHKQSQHRAEVIKVTPDQTGFPQIRAVNTCV